MGLPGKHVGPATDLGEGTAVHFKRPLAAQNHGQHFPFTAATLVSFPCRQTEQLEIQQLTGI